MKTGSISMLEWTVIAVLVIVFVVGFFSIMGKLQAAPSFWYAGCTGDVDGQRCFKNSVLCGVQEGTKLKSGDQEVDVKSDKLIGIINPRCNIYTKRGPTACNSTYKMIKKESGDEVNFCVWVTDKAYDFNGDGNISTVPEFEEGGIERDGVESGCVANPDITCRELSQDTQPKCSDVARCEPLSAIQRAVNALPKRQ